MTPREPSAAAVVIALAVAAWLLILGSAAALVANGWPV